MREKGAWMSVQRVMTKAVRHKKMEVFESSQADWYSVSVPADAPREAARGRSEIERQETDLTDNIVSSLCSGSLLIKRTPPSQTQATMERLACTQRPSWY